MIGRLVVAACALAFANPGFGGTAEALAGPLEAIGRGCGYALGNTALGAVTDGTVETLGTGNVRVALQFTLPGGARSSRGTLVFNCAAGTSIGAAAEDAVLSPRALIRSEDAGGRYARRVAWEREAIGANWTAKVAHVDAAFGDGQRPPLNDYLVCETQRASPCIEIAMERPFEMPKTQTAGLMALIRDISVLHLAVPPR